MKIKKITHESHASEICEDYIKGNKLTKQQLAKYCEDQGILSALVVMELSEHPKKQKAFIRDMKKSLV